LSDDFYDTVVDLMQNRLSQWVAFTQPCWLDFEEKEDVAFGVYDYINDLHVFYVNEYGPSVIICVEGDIDFEPWTFYTHEWIVMEFVGVLRACTSMMREVVSSDKDLDLDPA
jgi:hypothetical protein